MLPGIWQPMRKHDSNEHLSTTCDAQDSDDVSSSVVLVSVSVRCGCAVAALRTRATADTRARGFTKESSSLSDAAGTKYFGPVSLILWCTAAAGPSPPRLPLPDLQDSAFLGAAGLLPDAGAAFLLLLPPRLGLPQSAQYLLCTFVSCMAVGALSRCRYWHS